MSEEFAGIWLNFYNDTEQYRYNFSASGTDFNNDKNGNVKDKDAYDSNNDKNNYEDGSVDDDDEDDSDDDDGRDNDDDVDDDASPERHGRRCLGVSPAEVHRAFLRLCPKHEG